MKDLMFSESQRNFRISGCILRKSELSCQCRNTCFEEILNVVSSFLCFCRKTETQTRMIFVEKGRYFVWKEVLFFNREFSACVKYIIHIFQALEKSFNPISCVVKVQLIITNFNPVSVFIKYKNLVKPFGLFRSCNSNFTPLNLSLKSTSDGQVTCIMTVRTANSCSTYWV